MLISIGKQKYGIGLTYHGSRLLPLQSHQQGMTDNLDRSPGIMLRVVRTYHQSSMKKSHEIAAMIWIAEVPIIPEPNITLEQQAWVKLRGLLICRGGNYLRVPLVSV